MKKGIKKILNSLAFSRKERVKHRELWNKSELIVFSLVCEV